MKTKCESKTDFVCEIGFSYEKFVATFTKALKSKHGMETRELTDDTNHFLSKNPIHLFKKSVIDAIPSQFEWRLEKLAENRCRITGSFYLPSWLRNRFRWIFIALGCVFFLLGSILLRYRKYEFTNTTKQTPLALLLSISLAFGAMFLHYIILDFCIRLRTRYFAFVRRTLRNIYQADLRDPAVDDLKLLPLKGSEIIDWGVTIFGVGTFICALAALLRGEIINDIVESKVAVLVLILCVILIFLLYRFSWQIEQRYSLITKATPVGLNFCVAFAVTSLLLGTPLIAHIWAKNAVNLQDQKVIGLQYAIMCSLQFFGWFLAGAVLFVSIQQFLCFYDGWLTGYNKHLELVFHQEAKEALQKNRVSLNLSQKTKVVIVLLFAIFTLSCWGGVFLNISIINALIAPHFRIIPFSHGETIVKATMSTASAILGRSREDVVASQI